MLYKLSVQILWLICERLFAFHHSHINVLQTLKTPSLLIIYPFISIIPGFHTIRVAQSCFSWELFVLSTSSLKIKTSKQNANKIVSVTLLYCHILAIDSSAKEHHPIARGLAGTPEAQRGVMVGKAHNRRTQSYLFQPWGIVKEFWCCK